MSSFPTRDLFGVSVAALSMDETVARCAEFVRAGQPAHHVVINAAKVVLMSDQPLLRDAIRSCDLISADGQPIVWASRIFRRPLPERVAGIDLMERLLAQAEKLAWPVFFLGAKTDVLLAFEDAVRRRFPGIVVAGRHHGYFHDDGAVADDIRRSGARLLFVAMPSPRKEYFIAEQSSRLGPLFTMGVGGSFDVWAGRTRRAPVWMQRAGLEWFHRFLQEPRRMWRRYLVGNLRFAVILMREARSTVTG